MKKLGEKEIMEVYKKCGANPQCELVTMSEPRNKLFTDLEANYLQTDLNVGVNKDTHHTTKK